MGKTVKLHIPKTGMYNARIARNVASKHFIRAVDEITENTRNEVFTRAPVGATGLLRNSIQTQRLDERRGEVYVNAPYAEVVERGRKAAPVAKSADRDLIRWLKKSSKGRKFMRAIERKYFPRRGKSRKSRAKRESQILRSALYLLKKGKREKPTKGQFFFRKGIKAAKSYNNSVAERTVERIAKEIGNE